MGSIINLALLDEATIIKIFRIFKFGFIHPQDTPGKVKGILVGIWRVEIQLILGFWDKGKETGQIGNA
jgi:hypothetical protein